MHPTNLPPWPVLPYGYAPAQPTRSALLRLSLSEERDRVHRRVEGFNWVNSPAWVHLTRTYGPRIVHEELVSIAVLAANRLSIRLDRDARRRKVVMVKWFQENWASIEPLLHEIVLDQ
jgi:hypothetical protein